MASSYAEIRLGLSGRRALIVPWHFVHGSHALAGSIEIKFDDPGRKPLIVPWHALRRLSDAEATGIFQAVFDDGLGAHSLRSLVRGVAPMGDREAIAAMVRLLREGRLVLVVLEDNGSYGALGVSRPKPQEQEREREREPFVAQPGRCALRVQVVLDDGAPLAGAAVTLTAPDGRFAERTANGAGRAELLELDSDGIGRAEIRPVQVPRWRSGAATPLPSTHTFDFPFERPISTEVPTGGTQQIMLRRPEVGFIDGVGLGFAPGSALLVPLADELSPMPALATALAQLRDAPELRLMIVAHASPEGTAQANDALALQRARCARHLLVGDSAAWVELAAEHGSPADVQRLLRHLARVHDWPTEPTRVDGIMDRAVTAAVSAFQSQYNAVFDGSLLVDGVVGKQTLAALFDAQCSELRHQLATLDVPEAPPRWFLAGEVLSAGPRVLAHPALAGSESAGGQRRVDLLLLADSIAWRERNGIDLLYDVARFRVVPIAPLPVGRFDLLLQLVDHYGRILASEPYRLVTDTEERAGTSDAQGMVIERNLDGRFARLECGEAVVIIDDPYVEVVKRRYQRVAPSDPGDDDDDWHDPDAPLPATDDELDDEDEDEFDDDDAAEDEASQEA